MDDNIEERLNDEGYFMNRDSEQGYRILQQLGIPPTMEANGMGVGEYDSNFYSKMMEYEKVRNEETEETEEAEETESVTYDLKNGDENMIGKSIESDKSKNKAAYPILFGINESKKRVKELYESASDSLKIFGESSDALREMAEIIIHRKL